MYCDAHCHLDSFKEIELPPDFIAVTSGYSHESNQKSVQIAGKHKNVFYSLGIAPQTAQKEGNLEDNLPAWEEFIGASSPVAIGEIGLDFHWGKTEEEKKRQETCLDSMLGLARSLSLPVVFHCRDAYPELFSTIESHKPGRFMLHCFSGDEHDARRAVDLGGTISIPPLPSKNRKKAIKEAGITNLVAETDAPCIGKTLTDINISIQIISRALGMDEAEAASQTFKNAISFFGIDSYAKHD